MRKTFVTALTLAVVVGVFAGPALAKGPQLERGNWLSDVATPVELASDDVTLETVNGTSYVRVAHNIASDYEGYTTLVQRVPNRIGGENAVAEDLEPGEQFDTAWLSILGPEGTSVTHKGTFSWYYEVDPDEWVSLTFTFDGHGNLLNVNGVAPE